MQTHEAPNFWGYTKTSFKLLILLDEGPYCKETTLLISRTG